MTTPINISDKERKMTGIIVILILGLIASVPLFPLAYGGEKKGGSTVGEGIVEVELSVQGMMCEGCVAKVKDALQAVEGVISVKVELKEGEAEVYAKKDIDPKRLADAVEKVGFKAQIKEVEYE